jgi:hypothetical protein
LIIRRQQRQQSSKIPGGVGEGIDTTLPPQKLKIYYKNKVLEQGMISCPYKGLRED